MMIDRAVLEQKLVEVRASQRKMLDNVNAADGAIQILELILKDHPASPDTPQTPQEPA